MDLKKYKPLYIIIAVSVLVYILHTIIVFSLDLKDVFDSFYFSLEILYLFFIACSIIILFILIKIREKNLDNVGMTFLLITSIKMVFCYLMVRPILSSSNDINSIEKVNFFMMFILFLAIETIVTIRILNNKQ